MSVREHEQNIAQLSSGTVRWLQILRDEFDSRLESVAVTHIRVEVECKSANSLRSLPLIFEYDYINCSV